jgi:hypothetical protein
METTYKSKIDIGLTFPIFIVLFGVGGLMVFMRVWAGFAIILLLLTFIIHMLLTTQYKIVGKSLRIKSGIFVNKSVSIDTIRKITETNSILSSPANSLDRLELRYNKFERIIISPKDKDGFIKILSELNPNIEIQLKNEK